jgi:asparagine synthase (glutamine-hydrolysing)
MCGLAGIVTTGAPPRALLDAMGASLAHRGPDDAGVWADDAAGVGLSHRRLAIVDLSPLGHQPMASADGRFVLAYNGEVYNHLALRRMLDAEAATAWRGHSDTETLVACIGRWGLRRTLEQAVGMFALALWDRQERVLSLARDRFGEKPLYYGWIGGDFAFASQLAPLRLHPRFANPVSRAALASLAAVAYVADPLSIYEGVFKLPPGTILTAPLAALRAPRTAPVAVGGSDLRLERYWSYDEVVGAGLADPFRDEEEATDAVEAALTEAIAGQAVADVPVGAFLSGGIDSSLVVALYQRLWPGRVTTFTIGSTEKGYDEAPFARRLAEHLGTEHHEQYVEAADALRLIPELPSIYDEPFADSSQLPTVLVSRLARSRVTVALSGDGGDELFAGYNRYFGTIRLWSALEWVPGPLRRGLGTAMGAVPPGAWNAVAGLCRGAGPPAFFGSRVRKVFRTLGRARRLDDFADMFLDEWAGGASPVLGADGRPLPAMALPGAPDAVRMMHLDATTYLPGDILTKVDRAAMSCSLETRVPFLDHRVAAVAARVPLSMKVRGGSGKAILRKLLFRHVPATFFDRPKAGFAVPVEQWLRGPLRDWAEALLDPKRLSADGYFDAGVVRARWTDLLEGRGQVAGPVWAVLMARAWLERQPAAAPELAIAS